MDKLTQEQQWGLAYLTLLHNTNIDKQNEQIAQSNKFIPRDQPERPLLERLTVDDFVAMKTLELADQGYRQLISFKKEQAMAAFDRLSVEDQTKLLAQLQLPDVLA